MPINLKICINARFEKMSQMVLFLPETKRRLIYAERKRRWRRFCFFIERSDLYENGKAMAAVLACLPGLKRSVASNLYEKGKSD